MGIGVNGVRAAVYGDSLSESGLVSGSGSPVSAEPDSESESPSDTGDTGSVVTISDDSAEVEGLGGSSPVGDGTGRLDTRLDREPSIIFAHQPWSDEYASTT